MPTLTRGATSIYYEVIGSGPPVLLFAPGGSLSSIALWSRAPFHPVRELSDEFRVIAMDQRNAGRSTAKVTASDGWHSYTDDHLALLDELGIDRCHILGMCIGSSFCLSLATRAPDRVAGAVLEQPIGLHDDNRGVFYEIFESWANGLAGRTDVTRAGLDGLKDNLYKGDFAFSVTREQVRACTVPLLVLRGNDVYHPAAISEEIARIAPRAELIQSWKEGDAVAAALARVKDFLRSNK